MRTTIPPPVEIHPEPPSDLIANDGEPLEDGWHRSQMNLLIDSLQYHWRDRNDYFAGGNMFIYFSRKQVFNKDFRGPDFFVVKDCEWNPAREYWATWDEGGRYPDVIVELISESTAEIDRVEKKKLYATTFKTPEYYCYDWREPRLEAFHLNQRNTYSSKKVTDGRVWSPQLDSFVGIWEGTFQDIETKWLRLFDAEGNLIPLRFEAAEARADRAEARIEVAEARADRAEARIDALEAELKKLRQQLEPPKRNGASK
jgi:Uma2 family endonuclease